MKSRLLVLFVSFGLAACGGSGGNSLPPPPPPPPPPEAGFINDGRLPEIVKWAREAYNLPAMATVIVQNGQVAEATAEGQRSAAGGPSVTIGDKWHLGSLTKAMTATLAGTLVEMSVIGWDTTPLDVWPELDTMIHTELRSITMRQLLSHTAGLRPFNSVPSQYDDKAAGTLIEKRRLLSADLLAEGPASPVGEEVYSNAGYIIAGAMMETVMSSSWETLMQDFVFAPLSMSESGFGAPGTTGAMTQPLGHWPQGSGYDPISPGPDADNPQVVGPAGTVHSSMGDYANFMVAHIDGARGVDGLLTAATFATLHDPVDNGSALGWGVADIDVMPGTISLVHAGSNQRWYAQVSLVPEFNIGVLLLTNAGGDKAAEAIHALEELIARRAANSL